MNDLASSLKEQAMAKLKDKAKVKGKQPFAGKEKRKPRTVEAVAATVIGKRLAKGKPDKKLPVPPPKQTRSVLVGDGELVELTPLTPEQQAEFDAKMKSTQSPTAKSDELRKQQVEAKREKQRIKGKAARARKKAIKNGDAAKMPVQGKAALAVIAAAKPPKESPHAKQGRLAKEKRAAKTARAARPKAEIKLRPDGLREGTAMATLVDTVCRKSGATNDELCKAVGWARCLPMVMKACERAKVKLRTEKKQGQPTRYFGTAR